MSGGLSNRSGVSAEVYVPSTGQRCLLPDMPGDSRDVHQMSEGRVHLILNCNLMDLSIWWIRGSIESIKLKDELIERSFTDRA